MLQNLAIVRTSNFDYICFSDFCPACIVSDGKTQEELDRMKTFSRTVGDITFVLKLSDVYQEIDRNRFDENIKNLQDTSCNWQVLNGNQKTYCSRCGGKPYEYADFVRMGHDIGVKCKRPDDPSHFRLALQCKAFGFSVFFGEPVMS